MMAAMNPIVASQRQGPMMRSIFIQPEAAANEAATRRNGDRLPPQPVAVFSRETPTLTQRANWPEVPEAFWLFEPNSELVRNRTPCSLLG